MSPEGTRLGRRAIILGPLCLAACGFSPAYAPGGPGDRLQGRVTVVAPDTPNGFRLRAALENRLGLARSGAVTLAVEPEVEAAEGGVLPDGTLGRRRYKGRATWRLTSASGAVLAEGEVEAFTGATVAGPTVSVRAAQADARERLMVLLADRIVARLLLLPPEALP